MPQHPRVSLEREAILLLRFWITSDYSARRDSNDTAAGTVHQVRQAMPGTAVIYPKLTLIRERQDLAGPANADLRQLYQFPCSLGHMVRLEVAKRKPCSLLNLLIRT